MGRTISPAEIIGLPLVNRNAYAMLSLTPGVMANSMSQQSNANGTPNFVIGLPSTDVQVNGSIDGGNPEVSFYLDGGLNINGIRNYGNQLPNPDALEEFRVETSDFSAQYGHMSSAVVTAVTKSGTNQFHGALFEFNRNTDFNAFPWNAPKNDQGQFINAPYHRNQFGGVIGGPDQEGQGVLLLQLWRPAPGGRRVCKRRQGSHGSRAPGRLHAAIFPVAANAKVLQLSGQHRSPMDMPGTKTHCTDRRPTPVRLYSVCIELTREQELRSERRTAPASARMRWQPRHGWQEYQRVDSAAQCDL